MTTKKPGSETTETNKRGRPEAQFDLDQVEKLAIIGCTEEEIAWFFDCNPRTVNRRKKRSEDFCHALEKGRNKGNMSLRRLQWKNAELGNVTMQIWLGKQRLGQTDRQEVKQEVEVRHVTEMTDEELEAVVRGTSAPSTTHTEH